MSDTLTLQPGSTVETTFGIGTVQDGPFRLGGSLDRMVTVRVGDTVAYIAECFWNTIKAVVPADEPAHDPMFFIPIYFGY